MISEDSVTSESLVINAPITLVWQLLIDFDRYPRWNRFCPSLLNRALIVGEVVEMQVDLGNGLQRQVEYIEHIEPGRSIVWSMGNDNRSKLYARRTQTLSPIDDDSCRYLSVDYFEGKLRTMVLEQNGPAIEKGFNLCAYDLKQYAEALHQSAEIEN